jgi:uncharacterized protein YebE (UPF0316 family)
MPESPIDLVIPLAVFVAGVADVAFGTGRMLMVTAGFRWQAAALAMVQILVFVIAISAVVTNLDKPLAIVGYVLGWGVGTFLGMWVEERIAIGFRLVQVISRDRSISVADRLRAHGYRVTQVEGVGMQGSVEIAMTVVPRRSVERLRERIIEVDPQAFMTIARAERPIGGSFAEEIRSRRWPWERSEIRPL